MADALQTKLKEVTAFALELIDHLNYCGWGDSWERECSEELRNRAEKFERESTHD